MINPGDRFKICFTPEYLDFADLPPGTRREYAKQYNHQQRTRARQLKALTFQCVSNDGQVVQAFNIADALKKPVFKFYDLSILTKV